MGFHQFMVPRLDGHKDFERCLGLVRKGVAGFIVFGGELGPLKEGIERLQRDSGPPLIIASDLERGLGQQVSGGSVFPPAMALGGLPPALRKKVFGVMASEAAYAGINVILAPVLDINTNPDNPIIAERAFGEEPRGVSRAAVEMIKALRRRGIMSCGKHFPGHGDTSTDSHIGLPAVDKSIEELNACELAPFKRAVEAGVDMMMMGHLSVPAIDPSGTAASLSEKAVKFLRKKMGFKGVIITDAMNMGAIGRYGKNEASLMALRAGVDILLHPDEPDETASFLKRNAPPISPKRLLAFRKRLITASPERPPFDESFAFEVAKAAIKTEGDFGPLREPCVLFLSDEKDSGIAPFISALRERFPRIRLLRRPPASGGDIIVAVLSKTRAWKGGPAMRLRDSIQRLEGKARVFVSFGSPYLIRGVPGAAKVYAWWDSEAAQRAAAGAVISLSS